MKMTITTILAFTALGTMSCHADALDDLLRELEAAELKPAAKKAPQAPTPPAPTKAPQPTAAPAKVKSAKITPSKEQQPITPRKEIRTPSVGGKREQRIMSLFQNKIAPIAESLFGLVESKETQQLVETAKKKRLEREKAVAAKAARGAPGRPRYGSVGGTGGRGYGGAPGRAFDGGWGSGGFGGGGFGKPSWSPTSGPSGWKPSTTEAKPSKMETPSTSATPETKKSDDSGGRYSAPEEKKKDELAPQKNAIDSYSQEIRDQLTHWTKQLQEAVNQTRKNTIVTTKMQPGNVIDKLKQLYDSRITKLRELPDQERKALEAKIKQEEGPLWNKFFKEETSNQQDEQFINTTNQPEKAKYTGIRNDLELFFGITLKTLP